MSFNDVFKNGFLENFQNGSLTLDTILISLGLAILFGLFIYFIYRINSKGGFYNRGFNKSLAILPVITAAIMLAMGSNLTISLGMVGALSIVRFRNAIKDPADLTYLFWSISLGIVLGAGLFGLAIFLSVAVALLVTLLDLIPSFRAPCVLVVSASAADAEKELTETIKKHAKNTKIRSRNVNNNGAEWIFEIRVRDEGALVEELSKTENILSVQLMTHDGEVRF